KFPAAAEMVDGQTAGVGASPAFCHSRGVLHSFDVVDREHSRALAVCISLAGDQSRPESAHDTGNVRTYSLAVCDFLKTSQNGIIVEGTALNDNMVPELRRAGHFDYLE